MRLPWRRKARQINSQPVSTKALELETAKEILSEVFHARPADVEEMILRRLEERDRDEERKALKKKDQVYGQKRSELGAHQRCLGRSTCSDVFGIVGVGQGDGHLIK